MTDQALPPAIRYLPLVPRARPPALPLRQRRIELHDLLRHASQTSDTEEGLARACEVMNKAALLASDTGSPDLAAALCRRQYEAFLPAAPLTAKAATFAVQPLINIGRLDIRAGRPTAAYTVFEALFTAAQGESAQVQEQDCPVGGLVSTAGERADLRRFLWAVLLADGTRALCAAARWQDALDHLHRYNGIGTRLLDGRQVAVLAALHRRNPDAAYTLLNETDCSHAWEHAVAACLTTATHRAAAHDPTAAVTAMATAVQDLPSTPAGAVFAARMGTLACELAPHHRALATHLIVTVMGSDDAHAAAAVMDSTVIEPQLSDAQRRVLRARIEQAELTETHRSDGEHKDLVEVCERATDLLVRHLGCMDGRATS